MTPQTFSLEMCRHLSSLAPEFEGHWWYVNWDEMLIICCLSAIHEYGQIENKICPAWQVEDVLRNLKEIVPDSTPFQRLGFAEHLGRLLLTPDTAYQKIEEYLWSILK
jgi:hypothetical protein